MRATLFVLAAAVGLAACEDDITEPAFALDAALFDDFDVDNDALLDPVEFETGFVNEDVFGTMDLDDDAFLDEEEFDNDLGVFADFDTDFDGFLNEDEFIGGTFDVFDTDDDVFVDEPEFGVGVELF